MGLATMRRYPGERTVCAPRAEIFEQGMPYVTGWSAAQHSTAVLSASLRRSGLDEGFEALRADVSVHGQGLVCLGTIPAEVVQQLTDLIADGLCAAIPAP